MLLFPQPCVDASRILEESAKLSAQVVRNMAGRVLAVAGYHVLKGTCLHALPPPSYFLDYIFQRYGNGSGNLTLEGESGALAGTTGGTGNGTPMST